MLRLAFRPGREGLALLAVAWLSGSGCTGADGSGGGAGDPGAPERPAPEASPERADGADVERPPDAPPEDRLAEGAWDLPAEPPSDLGPAEGADAGGDECSCPAACSPGEERCGAGSGVERCALDACGCRVFIPEAACGPHQACAMNAGVAACACKPAPIECGGASSGTYCSGTSTLLSCATDSNGCVFVESTSGCSANRSCQGPPGTASCECGGPGVHTCAPAESGFTCVDRHTRGTCTMAADGCYVITNITPCTGDQACQGSPGGAFCGCPAVSEPPVQGSGCTAAEQAAGDLRCDGTQVIRCQLDPVSGCTLWRTFSLCDPGLVCTTDGGRAVAYCGCPAVVDGTFYVDPVQGHDTSFSDPPAVRPTGATSPPACRFKTLGHAIEAGDSATSGPGANDWVSRDDSSTARIVATGTPPVVFMDEPPLVLDDRVSLVTSDSTPNPADFSIAGSIAGGDLVVVSGRGSFTGFTVQNAVVGGDPPATELRCTGGFRTLEGLAFDGSNDGPDATTALTGIKVEGGCVATVDDTQVGGADGPGGASGFASYGIWVANGKLASSRGLAIRNGAGAGVEIEGVSDGPSLVTTTDATLTRNGVGVTLTRTSGDARPALRLYGGSIAHNQGPGVLGSQADVLLDSSAAGPAVVEANGEDLSAYAIDLSTAEDSSAGSILNLGAGVLLRKNARGIRLTGAQAAINAAAIEESTQGEGLLIDNPAAASPFTVTLIGAEIAGNFGDGLVVAGAPGTPDLANLVAWTGGKAHGNGRVGGGNGIALSGADGEVTVTIKGVEIFDNGWSGIKVSGAATRATFQDNDVHDNHALKGSVGDQLNAAGVWFETPTTLSRFTGNRIHNNKGPELRFSAEQKGYADGVPGTWWNIASASGACDATSNSIYCYTEPGDLGISAFASLSGIHIDARAVTWQNAAPSNGVDFSDGGSGSVDPSVPCPPVATCP